MAATQTEIRKYLWDLMEQYRWYVTAYEVARSRYPGAANVPTRVALDTDAPEIPAMAWTDTGAGVIYLREGLLDGFNPNREDADVARRVLTEAANGRPTPAIQYEFDGKDRVHRAAQTAMAAFGVLGHEILHAAYSEHRMRTNWHLLLEDLRIEEIWMSIDPVRARPALRACASYWVLTPRSPMLGDPEVDLTRIQTPADVLQIYLLVVGRARVGVLAEDSHLVSSVRALASEILGWATCSDADDIVDRYCETAPNAMDPVGIADRLALSEELARLLPGSPDASTGCGCVIVGVEAPEDVSEGSGAGEKQEESGEPADGASVGEASSEDGSDSTDGPVGSAASSEPATPGFQTGEFDSSGQKDEGDLREDRDLDSAGSLALTPEQVAAMAEALSSGLREVANINSRSGWGIENSEIDGYLLRTLITPKVAAEQVFGVRAQALHRDRLAGETR